MCYNKEELFEYFRNEIELFIHIMYNSITWSGGNMKKFIKRHRYTCILLLIFILLVVLGFKVKEMLVPDEGKATYGERLKDIGKHPIGDSVYKHVDEEYAKNNNVIKVTHRLQGKVLNYFITVGEKVSVKDAKAIGEALIGYLNEDILGYYSVQIYVMKEDTKLNNFPIIGLKDPLSEKVSWTKDREITESGKNEE